MEPNWIITLLLAAAISIPLSVLANLLTPKVSAWLDKRGLESKGKSLQTLRSDYTRIKSLRENPNALRLWLAMGITHLLVSILALITFGFFVSLTQELNRLIPEFFGKYFSLMQFIVVATGFSLALYLSGNVSSIMQDMNRLRDFDEYEKNALEEINKLEQTVSRAQ